jgi:endoglucanase
MLAHPPSGWGRFWTGEIAVRFYLLSFALLFVLAYSSPAEEGVSSKPLLANGNLETDANSDQWPDGWAKAKSGVVWKEEDGNHFLRLTSSQPGETVLLYQPVTLTQGVQALTLTFKLRCTDLKPGKQAWFDARLLLEFKNAAGEKLSGGPSAPYVRKDTAGWTERKLSFLVPEGAHTLEFMPALFQVERGVLDLDDVVLQAVDAEPLREAAKLAAAAALEKQQQAAATRRTKATAALASEGSLVSNGNFETDKNNDGSPDGWGKFKDGIRWEAEGDNHFLRLISQTPGQTVLVYRELDLPAGTEAVEFSWRQRTSNLKAGKENYFDARIMLEFKDEAGKKMSHKPSPPNTRGNTEGWVEKKTQFLVPPGALTLVLMPALFQVERGTYDLDDLKFTPIEAAPLIAAAAAVAEEERRALVPPEEPNRTKWPLPLHVRGNQILNSKDEPVWLQGMNVVSLEFSLRGEKVMKSALTAVDDWRANCIRLPVKESYWFGRESGQKDGGAAYRELVDQVITLVANRGAYVVLDLHRFRAPNAAHVEFWKDAAGKYKDHPAVLFDLFNEPHGVTWEVWKDGGFVAEKTKPADEDSFLTPEEKAKAKQGFDSPGMQRLIDAVREAGAKNIVIVGGLDWAYDLSGIANGFALDDKGGRGIVYSTHIYPWKRDWAGKVLLIAEKHPIFVGEVGADIKKMDFLPPEVQEDPYTWVPDMLGLIQKHKFHWTAFSFHPKASPVMITGWDYTPTPFWGVFVKDALSGKSFVLQKLR